MDSLEKAVDLALKFGSDRNKDRQTIIAAMKQLATLSERARGVWEEYLTSPGKPGDKWSLITWVGPERMRRLHEINLEAKSAVKRIADTAGPAAGRFDQLDEDFIVLAYRQLREGETGPEAAKEAVETTNTRLAHLGDLVSRIERTPPANKPSGAPKAKAKATKPKKSKPKAGKKKAAKKKATRKSK